MDKKCERGIVEKPCLLRTLEDCEGGALTVALSADGRRFTLDLCDGTVRLWDLATVSALQTLKGHNRGAFSVAFSADSKRLASGSGMGWLGHGA